MSDVTAFRQRNGIRSVLARSGSGLWGNLTHGEGRVAEVLWGLIYGTDWAQTEEFIPAPTDSLICPLCLVSISLLTVSCQLMWDLPKLSASFTCWHRILNGFLSRPREEYGLWCYVREFVFIVWFLGNLIRSVGVWIRCTIRTSVSKHCESNKSCLHIKDGCRLWFKLVVAIRSRMYGRNIRTKPLKAQIVWIVLIQLQHHSHLCNAYRLLSSLGRKPLFFF